MVDATEPSGDGAGSGDAAASGPTPLHRQLTAPQRRLRDLPQLLIRALRLVRDAAPREFRLTAGLQLMASAGVAAQLFITRSLLGHILSGRTRGYGAAAPDIVALAVVLAVIGVANAARSEIQRTLAELVSRYALGRVVAVSTAVDLLAFETPAFHDHQQRALISSATRPLQMTNGLLGLVGSLMGTVGIGVALLTIQPLLVLLVLVAFVPVWVATLAASQAMYRYAVEQTERDRLRLYLQTLLTDKAAAKEVRAYDNEQFLRARYDNLYVERIAALREVVRKRTLQGVLGASLTALLTGAVLALITILLAQGRLSLSDAGVSAGAIVLLGSQLQTLAQATGQLFESALFVRDFNSFLSLRPENFSNARGDDAAPDRVARVQVSNVSFTYPSREEASLRNVSLELREGKVIALVGENGSGKTTLAKLVAGLYPPTAGTISWNGVDISSVNPSELRGQVAVLFQDFLHYHMTAGANIGLGNQQQFDVAEAVTAAARSAGAHAFLTELPNGYETLLGPEFYGGVDLSGGQWQRVALARAFMRDAKIIILDEPTASLDPRAEAELFARVRELFAGRTVVLISHRFVSVRLADEIYVLEAGQVVEHGHHTELMAQAGTYARLYNLQASAYGLSSLPATT